jgi:hypothetical protein
MRGEDGVLVLGIHLMLLGQGKSVGLYDTSLRFYGMRHVDSNRTHQCCTLNTTGSDGVDNCVHPLQTVSDVGLTRSG